MPVYKLTNELVFPSPFLAEDDGLLAFGGDLSARRLLLAYSMGIFPWYSESEPILWWSPNPRFAMLPEDIKISKSMKQVLKKQLFRITLDENFEDVVRNCQQKKRTGQSGTWITEEMLAAYQYLHHVGLAHSVEVWNKNNELVGGLYGVALGSCFFGESMFAHESNASKTGYITLVKQLQKWQFDLIDCQVYTKHLESLGAKNMSRTQFINSLNKCLQQETLQKKWSLDI
ncbi:MAG: leucyl/phenylalanyl-tRNA--protein transferase [Chitinophagales bacterium]